MDAQVPPPGAPRGPRPGMAPLNYYPGGNQKNPNALADNMQGLNIGRPSSGIPASGPVRPPSPFGQSPLPGGVSRPAAPNMRPTGPPPGSQPPPFGSTPPPGSFAGGVRTPSSGGGLVSPPGSRPGQFGSSLPLTSGPAFTPPTNQVGGLTSNGSGSAMGPPGPLGNGPRFHPAGNVPQQQLPVGPPPLPMGAPQGHMAPPTMRSLLQSSSSPPATPAQPTVPFAAPPQGSPPPRGPPYEAQGWSMQHQQVAPSPAVHGSIQPTGMFGMPPPPPAQSMTTIRPTMGQAGRPIPSSNVDLNQIPRIVQNSTVLLHETRQGSQANLPPPATSDYIIKDTGNCSPRYMRCTINQIPCIVDLLTTSGMQLALMVQPFALPHPSEEAIQIVDFGESGPVRCSRCKGYVNPFFKFIDHGRQFICNLCGFTDETPRDYHCNLGPDGRRRDADERPELCRGTVEFVATKDYMVRDPMPAVYFFLIDVSMNAIQTGATAAACSAINQVINDLPEGPRTFVGIATFDSTIHFYNLKRALEQPLMLVVPDVHDVYTPLQSDIIVPVSECRQQLEVLLESIPSMFQNSKTSESAFGAAIKASFLALKNTGGKLLVFQSVLPSVGIAALSAREAEGRSNISAGEKEAHKLLQPADNTLKTMAIEFAEYQVCVDIFITTQTYVDISSISVVPRTTAGQVYYYYPFSALSDTAKLYNDLRWNITRPQGFEAVMRVRCSQGIQVQDYHGSFCKRIPTDVDLPGIDCDKTIMVTLKHDDKMQDGSECALQCALLYTTVYGQRRIRVTTLSLPCTSMMSNLFRSADLDTQFSCILKQAASEVPSIPLLQIRERVTNHCISILHAYRKFCAGVSPSGELKLPESHKLLPLYTLALIKSTGLRSETRLDDRSFWINYVSSIPIPLAIPLVIPRMFAIHDLNSYEGDGPLVPITIPLSSEHVSDNGIYLLENGDDCLIYIGRSVDPDILKKLLGFSSFDEISTQYVLQEYDNPLSNRLNELVNEIRRQRCSYLRLRLCKSGDPSGMMFFSYMIEDNNPGGLSYVDFLVHVHRQIQMKLS